MRSTPSRPASPPGKPTTDGAADPAAAEVACGLRCLCGSLLARYVPGGVELKCRRCKRVIVVHPEGQPTETTE